MRSQNWGDTRLAMYLKLKGRFWMVANENLKQKLIYPDMLFEKKEAATQGTVFQVRGEHNLYH